MVWSTILEQRAPALNYPGLDGFLGTRASLMMDVVFLAMFLVLAILLLSIYLVRYRQRYNLHKKIQLGLAGVLLLAVVLFEIDVRIHGWRERAIESPYYGPVESPSAPLAFFYQSVLGFEQVPGWVFTALGIHLVFAISAPLLWGYVIVQALRKFPSPPQPGPYSRRHAFWGRLAAVDLALTSITGWLFYWLAFVA